MLITVSKVLPLALTPSKYFRSGHQQQEELNEVVSPFESWLRECPLNPWIQRSPAAPLLPTWSCSYSQLGRAGGWPRSSNSLFSQGALALLPWEAVPVAAFIQGAILAFYYHFTSPAKSQITNSSHSSNWPVLGCLTAAAWGYNTIQESWALV